MLQFNSKDTVISFYHFPPNLASSAKKTSILIDFFLEVPFVVFKCFDIGAPPRTSFEMECNLEAIIRTQDYSICSMAKF